MAADNDKLMATLYSKLSDVLTVGSNIQAPGHSFLVLMNPGTLLDPELDLTDPDDEFLWAGTLNRIPLPNPIFQESSLAIPDVYRGILNGKELPLVTLTPAQQAQLDKANNLLADAEGNDTPVFVRYTNLMFAYQDALTAFQEAQANFRNEGTPIPPRTASDLKAAKMKWDSLGHRLEIENAVATINNLQGLDPNRWWTQLAAAVERNTQSDTDGNPFYRTRTSPGYQTFFGDKGWTRFTFSQKDVENQETSRSLSTGGSAGVAAGMWRASATAQYTENQGFKKTQTTDITISLEVMRVSISRPWIDPLVLRSRTWRWADVSGELISNGADASLGHTPKGLMPLYPTTLVLSRNLVMEGAFDAEEGAWIDKSLKTEVSVGYGPFSIQGNYNQSSGEKSSKARRDGNKISNPDVQIIGMFCEVLPTSPNPSPQLKWPTELELGHLPEFNPEAMERLRQRAEGRLEALAAR